MIVIAIVGVGLALFGYLMWYVSPQEVLETVIVIANTESGCIAETLDGFSVNIGPCNAEEGDMVSAKVDAKLKERALLMNPSR